MDKRLIILADRDADNRSRLADLFQRAGYRVETAGSVVDLLCNTLENPPPVLMLGTDFDPHIASAELMHLCKQCNRNLHVIMVSDDVPLSLAREVREEGLFYHALKPVTACDGEELLAAVACAFGSHHPVPQASAMRSQAGEFAVQSAPEAKARPTQLRNRMLGFAFALAALVLGASYLLFSTVSVIRTGGNTIILIFFGFCALIIATQFLPIFRIKLPANAGAKHQVTTKDASLHGK